MTDSRAARLPAAVLWDMDGTIVDTEEHWIAAADEILRGGGVRVRRVDLEPLVGMALTDGAAVMRRLGAAEDTSTLVARWAEIATRNTAVGGLTWRPGAVELLAALRVEGVPLALVTMSYRGYADGVIRALPPGTFTVTVTGDDVERGKPAPDAYALATRLLGLPAAACVAIEDSLIGLAAARAAGVRTIGVPHHVDIPAGSADAVWPTLEGRTPADLAVPAV